MLVELGLVEQRGVEGTGARSPCLPSYTTNW